MGFAFRLVTAHAEVQIFENAASGPALTAIESARRSLDIEIYEMEDPQIREAIRKAIARGVRVRVVHEPASVGKSCRPAEPERPLDSPVCIDLKRLRNQIQAAGGAFRVYAKAQLCPKASRTCFQHGKMILVDGSKVWFSTGNFNPSSLCHVDEPSDRCNKDYTLSETRPWVVETMKRWFEADLRGEPVGDLSQRVPNLTVSPFAETKLLEFVRGARRSLAVENQYLKYEAFNLEIAQAARRGVKVTITVSDPCAFGRPSPSEMDRFVSNMTTFERVGASIRVFPLAQRVGGQPGYLHAKAMVVDGRRAWMGSINGSEGAFRSNREFGLVFDDPEAVRLLERWMRDNHSHPKALPWRIAAACGRAS